MLGYLKKRYRNHLDKVLSTIKLIDIEERYDLHFSRFYGLYFANAAKWLRMTPTQVSIISLVIGVVGGGLLYYQDQLVMTVIGGLLVIWAGVLDSADGQLARMTGQSSDIGRVIDGLIDNLVFVACYIGASLYLVPVYSGWVFICTIAAGFAHSYKAAVYEFYKSEYLSLVGKSNAGFIPIHIEEIKPAGDTWYHKVMHLINKDYTAKQIRYTTRTPEQRRSMRELSKSKPEEFNKLYKKYNFKMLFWWAWLGGSNTHRNAIILFSLLGRFEIYLSLSLIWTIGYWPLNRIQRRYDQNLLRQMKKS